MEQQGWPKEPVTAVVKSGPTNGKSAPPANAEKRGIPTLSISATALKFPDLWGVVSVFLRAGHGLAAC